MGRTGEDPFKVMSDPAANDAQVEAARDAVIQCSERSGIYGGIGYIGIAEPRATIDRRGVQHSVVGYDGQLTRAVQPNQQTNYPDFPA